MNRVGRASRVTFRHHAALTVAATVTIVGGTPLVAAAPWLAPALLVPLAVAIWAWRAGTDADADGLRVRALFGERRIPWTDVTRLVPIGGNRVAAELADGSAVPLTAVTPAHLPRLVSASGQRLSTAPE